jgi:hypothetical protein
MLARREMSLATDPRTEIRRRDTAPVLVVGVLARPSTKSLDKSEPAERAVA